MKRKFQEQSNGKTKKMKKCKTDNEEFNTSFTG